MSPISLHTTQLEHGLLAEGVQDFSLSQILDCGQCFTFSPIPVSDALDGLCQTWQGWAGDHRLTISQHQNGSLLFHGVDAGQFESFWRNYFDLDTDYSRIKAQLSQDPILRQAIQYAPGIRILRQDGWEALCCFIISQNNNIPRIRGIVRRLCETFGQPLGEGCFSFPSAQTLATATEADLAVLRCGFRARYLLDAARRVHSGQVDFDAVRSLPLEQARQQLMTICGVGPKVADCTLLFGCYRLECCPMDVWMKRVFSSLYPQGLPDCTQGYWGIAQQYLFHYARSCPQILEPRQEVLA